MPNIGFTSITVSQEVYDRFFEVYEKKKPELILEGINSFSGYVTGQIQETMKAHKTKMRFGVIMAEKGRLVIYDSHIDRIIEIDPRKGDYGYCLHCERDNCLHCGFAVSLPQFYKT